MHLLRFILWSVKTEEVNNNRETQSRSSLVADNRLLSSQPCHLFVLFLIYNSFYLYLHIYTVSQSSLTKDETVGQVSLVYMALWLPPALCHYM